ncbi:putative O-methyltransferase [Bernardetia litoralis DSM 6794]|uniref:tRNA1(Val) (adenine(37)-N6)-methyltransferase n=2 Tax=Bernardetia litoralis TaxID=999 RepID=I4APE8_BERLS|nr:putative O-methyltransferase [Bernardetia litoralis DSM 6794]
MFEFKKFSINQENCAMKICTDACIFGGYINVSQSKSILDIGTGTGLLSLMIAQRTEKTLQKPNITAVEIEKDAFLTAKQNFENSIYTDRLTIFNQSIQDFSENHFSTFDHIISNPPFFLHQSKTKNNSKNLALHSEALSFDDLLKSIDKLLSKNGKCDILLPAFEMDIFIKKAKKYSLFPQKKLIIYTRKEKEIFRVIIRFEKKNTQNKEIIENNFIIYKSKGEKDIELNRGYTEQFIELLRDFYIIF